MGVVPSHMGDMCVCRVHGEVGRRRPSTPGDNPLALFDKCHGLFCMQTGTLDQRLNIPSKEQLVVHWCSVSAGLIDSQHHENGFMAKYVALRLSMWLYG